MIFLKLFSDSYLKVSDKQHVTINCLNVQINLNKFINVSKHSLYSKSILKSPFFVKKIERSVFHQVY